jgi:hypothetical protein
MTYAYRPKPLVSTERLWVLVSLAVAGAIGALAAFGSVTYAAPIVALLSVIALLSIPVSWQIWALSTSCFLISGPLIYFMKLDAARWLPLLLALGLYLPLIFSSLRFRLAGGPGIWPAFMGMLVLFIACISFGSLYESPRLSELITAARSYLAYWSIVFVIGIGLVREQHIHAMWKFLLAMALLQLPVTFYQHFFVSKASMRVASWDAVVGTFPGNPEGGGASAGMGVFILIMVVWVLAMWRRKVLGGHWVAFMVVSTVVTMALAEIKAVVLLIPVAVAMVFYKEVLQRPLQSFAALLVGAAMVAGLLAGYQALYYDKGFTLAKNSSGSPLESIENQLNPSRVLETENGLIQMSRAALMADWWQRNVTKGDFEHALLGYGVGATSSSRLGPGELVGKYPFAIDMTTTTILLWETGLAGHILLALTLLMAANSASRSSKDARVPTVHQATLQAVSIGLILLTATMAYKNFILRTSPSQFLLVFMLGQTLYWSRKLNTPIQRLRSGMSKEHASVDQPLAPVLKGARGRLVRR